MVNILVVDDDRLILEVFTRILASAQVETHCASSGEEALEKMKQRTFSLMITDLDMPGLDGLELSRRGHELAPHMPIIMDTGGISPEIIRRAQEIGIAKVISKPFLPHEMLAAIRDLMGDRWELPSSTGQAPGRSPSEETSSDNFSRWDQSSEVGGIRRISKSRGFY